MNRWLKTYPSKFDNELLDEKPYCNGYAWDYLCSRANFKARVVTFRGEYIPVERGEFITSKAKLAKKFGWTFRKVSGFLSALKREDMLQYRTTNRYLWLKVLNYDKYQGNGFESVGQNDIQTVGQTTRQTTRQEYRQEHTDKNVKKVKNDKNVEREASPSRSITILDDHTTLTELQGKFQKLNVRREVEKMKDWLKANGRVQKDYVAFARNWLRKTEERQPKVTGMVFCPKCGKQVLSAHLTTHRCVTQVSSFAQQLANQMP